MDEVHLLAEEEQESQTGGAKDLGIRWIRRLVLIGIGLGIFQQFTGINSVMYYGTQLLQDAGFSNNAAIAANTLNGLFSVLGISVGIMLINRIDRRRMLLGGFILTTTFHLLVGLSAVLIPDGSPIKPYFILVFVVLFVFSMQGTLGPLVWLMLAEIFPLKIRSFVMGICIFMLWIANASVALLFPPVVEALGSPRRSSSSPDSGCWRSCSSPPRCPKRAASHSRSSRTIFGSCTPDAAGRPWPIGRPTCRAPL